MTKLLSLLALTSTVVFALFVFMASLVTAKTAVHNTTPTFEPIEFVQPPKDSEVKTIPRTLIPPPTRPVPPPNAVSPSIQTPGPEVQIKVPTTHIEQTTSVNDFVANDSAARPVMRVAPRYPIDAAQQGVQGWVVLSFDINEAGGVDNVQIIDSSPKRIFDKAAKQALRKWKYRAKVVDGKTIAQRGMSIQLDFKLDQS
ncbi:energy transducer TonB [Thalassotalea ponticola]|uniref:energy transducer TonB n=1 Tax=Thalassotalea ponticola TaxID=1523392 RepID=UPI0025B605C6|nr:energy transducer TonB [Thalassotalea ponticola]MDN3651311.1 energy transducer TonB [Thalassotalea ponticola]